MSNGIIAIIVVSSCLVYVFGAGATWAVFRHRNWDMDDPGPWFGSALWPLALPAMLASRIVERWLAPKPPKATARVKDQA